MARYGNDKPDLRFGLELVEFTEYFSEHAVPRVPGRRTSAPSSCPAARRSRARQLDAWQEWAKQRGAKGLAYVLVGEDGELGGPVAKNLTDAERAGLAERVGAKPGDCVFFAAGADRAVARRCSARPASRSAGGAG